MHGVPSARKALGFGMFLVFGQKASELRRENSVVWRILFLVGVDHLVLLAAVNIDTFQIKPALLFR
jgi:hypothetical protein